MSQSKRIAMHKRNLLFYLMILLNVCSAVSANTWKVLWYMDASDGLSDMAIKNMTDAMRAKPNAQVEWLIQLHAYFDAGVRYRITKDGLTFLQEVTLSGNGKQDFINAAAWAFKNNTADHTMLIMANHGWGILEPWWNDQAQEWEVDAGSLLSQNMNKNNIINAVEQHKKHRGFMFSAAPRTYLHNNELADGLAYIKDRLLGGKKLDILAFDTCMGDMFEIGYLAAPYAHYLIGNQSCSLLDGFDYQGVIQVLNQGLGARSVCIGMVNAFDAYYNRYDESGIYTHAALDLSRIQAVSKELDAVVQQLLKLPRAKQVVIKACAAAPRFCLWPMYTDLVAFCMCLEDQLALLRQSDDVVAVQYALERLYQGVAQLVVARCGGSSTEGLANGVAIYMPPAAIDSGYYGTLFAQESLWIRLLELLL